MWPSPELASRIAVIFNWVFIGSLVAGLISISMIYWMARVKESYWDQLRKSSDEKIAELNKDTARLSAEADASKAQVAESELKLEQLRKQVAPRVINVLEFAEELKSGPTASARIIYPKDDVESHALSMQIFFGLKGAGWTVDLPSPIQPSDSNIFSDGGDDLFSKTPAPLAAGGNATGVSVIVNQTGSSDAREAGRMLEDALLKALGSVMTTEYPLLEDARIVVGPKP